MDSKMTKINTKIVKLELEVKSLKEKEKINDENQKAIHELALLVNTLTTNVSHMLLEQKDQGNRIVSLEKKPMESIIYYKRLIISTIITASLGAIAGAIIAYNITK